MMRRKKIVRLVKIIVFQVYRFLQPWGSPCLQSLFLDEGNDLILSGNEISWLVEYDRMIEQTENSLSEKELNILSERWDLDFTLDDTSSDKPLISVILMPKDE